MTGAAPEHEDLLYAEPLEQRQGGMAVRDESKLDLNVTNGIPQIEVEMRFEVANRVAEFRQFFLQGNPLVA